MAWHCDCCLPVIEIQIQLQIDQQTYVYSTLWSGKYKYRYILLFSCWVSLGFLSTSSKYFLQWQCQMLTDADRLELCISTMCTLCILYIVHIMHVVHIVHIVHVVYCAYCAHCADLTCPTNNDLLLACLWMQSDQLSVISWSVISYQWSADFQLRDHSSPPLTPLSTRAGQKSLRKWKSLTLEVHMCIYLTMVTSEPQERTLSPASWKYLKAGNTNLSKSSQLLRQYQGLDSRPWWL